MRGLKFLFKGWVRWKWSIVLTAVLFVGVLVLCCCAKEKLGHKEYLMAAAFLPVAYCTVLIMGTIISFSNITGNKLMLSSPIAKELYTVSVPLFIIILTLGSMIAANGTYFIVLAAQGASAEYYSDAFVFMAIGGGLNILTTSLFSRVMFGGMLGLYVHLMPYMGFILTLNEHTKRFGFGLPLQVSVLIFAGVIAAATAASFVINRAFFRKLNFKQPAAAYAAR